METEFKIKPLTKEQIIISIDRLTRFKSTEDKYLRVFKDVVTSNLISPKFKKNELDLMEYKILKDLAEKVINFSIQELTYSKSNNFDINKKLFDYEKSVFKFDKNVEELLKNKIDYNSAIKLFDGGVWTPPYNNDLPHNLKWLKSLVEINHQSRLGLPAQQQLDMTNQIETRQKFSLRFPIEKVLLVEGITEEILLPKFAKLYGYDFDKEGIHLISAGGKNQVVKIFYQLAEILKLPIFVLLDSDAKENFEEIKSKLSQNNTIRKTICDKVYILKNGEFEDILPLNLIKRTINRHFSNYFSIKLDDLRTHEYMTKTLDNLLKERGLEFKKAEFANLVSQNIESVKDISTEIEEIFEALKKTEEYL